MCCVMKIGAGNPAGAACRIDSSAEGPPVEAPIATAYSGSRAPVPAGGVQAIGRCSRGEMCLNTRISATMRTRRTICAPSRS
jgi:hypothetical protein